MSGADGPGVWYVAAGYALPAGIEAYLLHYATELRQHGFDTRIIVFQPLPRKPHRYLKAVRERGIPIESLYEPCRAMALLLTAVKAIPWLLRRPSSAGGLSSLFGWELKKLGLRRLRRMLANDRPDVVHVKGRVIAEAFPLFPTERTIYQHALMGTVDPSWTEPEVEAFRSFTNRIARVFVQGRVIAETMAREFGITRPIDVIPTMVPDEWKAEGRDHRVSSIDYRPEDQAPSTKHQARTTRFGILCRFTEQKGIAFILEALRMFRDRHGEADFTFAGIGPLEDEIKDFIARHDLTHVRIIRVASPGEVLKQMDVFVHPGLDDAMPVSMVEAMMCGVPCIGTKVGAVPELVRDGVDGLLIRPGSADEILLAMERFAQMDTGEREKFATRARARYVELCRPDKVGAQVAEHYRAIIQEATASGSGASVAGAAGFEGD